MSDFEVKDIEDLKKVLEVVGDKVPHLITELLNSVLNKQNADDFAKQVSAFYKELKDTGMSEENAMKLTQSFMESRDPMTLIKKVIRDSNLGEEMSSRGRRGKHRHSGHEEHEEEDDEEE